MIVLFGQLSHAIEPVLKRGHLHRAAGMRSSNRAHALQSPSAGVGARPGAERVVLLQEVIALVKVGLLDAIEDLGVHDVLILPRSLMTMRMRRLGRALKHGRGRDGSSCRQPSFPGH